MPFILHALKKISYLLLALILPGLIFVFLKYAGRNEFTVPVYYEAGTGALPGDCSTSTLIPYVLPDSLWKVPGVKQWKANVLVFGKPASVTTELQAAIDDEFGNEIVWVGDESSVFADSVIRGRWEKCVFILRKPWQAVLFDDGGRIRGYYSLDSREEKDRLRVELKIVLKKY